MEEKLHEYSKYVLFYLITIIANMIISALSDSFLNVNVGGGAGANGTIDFNSILNIIVMIFQIIFLYKMSAASKYYKKAYILLIIGVVLSFGSFVVMLFSVLNNLADISVVLNTMVVVVIILLIAITLELIAAYFVYRGHKDVSLLMNDEKLAKRFTLIWYLQVALYLLTGIFILQIFNINNVANFVNFLNGILWIGIVFFVVGLAVQIMQIIYLYKLYKESKEYQDYHDSDSGFYNSDVIDVTPQEVNETQEVKETIQDTQEKVEDVNQDLDNKDSETNE